MKKISVVASCFNEEENVEELYRRVVLVFENLARYELEMVLIDNASTDATAAKLRGLAQRDKRVKVILNARNFGHIRSPMHAFLAATGDAVITMVSDLQDPPELIPAFLEAWEEGFLKVVAVKPTAQENFIVFNLRKLFYRFLNAISEIPLINNFTGFGLYDRIVVEHMRALQDPYPYFRGLVNEIGFAMKTVTFDQPRRVRGLTKNNFFTLYDIAMLGITNHSKLPLRMATIGGFLMSAFSLLVALGYLMYKLMFWNEFALGLAPMVIGLFFLFSVQMFFVGLLGEYILAIHRHVLNRPLVVEKERINF
ncbi:MAG: glycosyltransferase family 2 protein [Magnetococcales bacterium]|nr:glycosyltransferase family 2 protein [Magnetococcales bacterium]MBF0154988.1 glycosyltransferase family 2 protein [Magnetococcales bacterium]